MKNKLHDGHLGRSQIAVIDDLLAGLNQREALRKNHVSPFRYRKWLRNPLFKREFADRKESFTSQRKFILISSLPKAARRLAELINAQKDEVARKACLDIINFQKSDAEQEKADRAERAERESHQPKISEAKAAKLWAIMAEPDEPQAHVAQPPSAVISSQLSDQYPQDDGWQPPQADGNADVLAGAAVCGIAPSLLAQAFPDGLPPDYLEKLRQIAQSPGSNPDREQGLKNFTESQASIQRRKHLIRTC